MIDVPVLHCAKCGSKLDIKRGGPVWTVLCTGCGAELSIGGRNTDLFDAYDAYTKAIQSGDITPTTTRKITSSKSEPSRRKTKKQHSRGRVQTKTEIQKAVRAGGADLSTIPDGISSILDAGIDYLVKYEFMPATDAEYGCPLDDLLISRRLKKYLKGKGIDNLYLFQEKAFDAIRSGENVVIAAPTAQGKTEGFILPIIQKLTETIQESFMNPGVRALLVYPTKALARDQYEKIKKMCKQSSLTVAIFDGDVAQHARRKIYDCPPDLLLTNPDVLHYHLGYARSQLIPLLRTVKYVVLDEIHLYTGSMGSNIFYILKRLELECGDFQKIGASATISNPKEFADLLFDVDTHLIESASARRGPIHFMMYYPEVRSKYRMIVNLVQMLRSGGFKTLVFGNTHSEAEVLNMLLRDIGVRSMVHRAGLPKKYRTKVENQFKSGELQILVSTPTLELGIDIGDLDSVVSMIVSITRLTQRIGRAGRKGQESVAILALREKDPISSFYKHKPDKYFTDIDAAYMEPDNEVVSYYQLIAAAFSGKLHIDTFPQQRKTLDQLVEEGLLKIDSKGNIRVVNYDEAQKKWRSYSIRGIGDTVQIKFDRKTLGERSMPMAAQELHPGAIYLHGGQNFMSVDFKYTSGLGRAKVVPFQDRSFHTRPLYQTFPKILSVNEEQELLGLKMLYCTLEMTQTVYGYVKRETRSGTVLERLDIPAPIEYSFKTRGFAFRAPEPVKPINDYIAGKMTQLEGPVMGPAELYGGAFHALEHVVIESSDMLTGGGTREIGGVSMGDSGIIFVYDGSPGGNGASKLLFKRFDDALERTEIILKQCDCKTVDGCPLCTYSYQCGNNNRPLFRFGALDSVKRILEHAETSVDTDNYMGYQPLV